VHVIPNGVTAPLAFGTIDGQTRTTERVGPRTALFLGRIYPVKGLPMLVEAWAKVRPPGWRLQIAGPDEAGHRAKVEAAVAAANLKDVVTFLGPIAGEAKQSVLFSADLFVLPSHSESFGMAVAEALAHGLPVLTTTGAPWPMLRQLDCGWWVDPTVDGLASGLKQATTQPPETLRAMGAKGREWVMTEFGWPSVANEFLRIYHEMSASRP
jgi:glycosyltransferase involved in cell wall biosynthesis